MQNSHVSIIIFFHADGHDEFGASLKGSRKHLRPQQFETNVSECTQPHLRFPGSLGGVTAVAGRTASLLSTTTYSVHNYSAAASEPADCHKSGPKRLPIRLPRSCLCHKRPRKSKLRHLLKRRLHFRNVQLQK